MAMTIDLHGEWKFCLDADKVGIENKYYERAFHDTITLPATTAEAEKGIRGDAKETGYLTEAYHFEGYAWYSRVLEIPKEHIGDLAQLIIERTRISYVWLDDCFVGKQDSFAVAHKYDLTEYLTGVSHRLTIMVSNVDYKTPGGHMTSPDTQTNWNGMLGRIALEFESMVRVGNLCVTSSAERRSLDVSFSMEFASAFIEGSGSFAGDTLPAGEWKNVEKQDAEAVWAHIVCCPVERKECNREDAEMNSDSVEDDCHVSGETLVETYIELPLQSGITEHTLRIDIPQEREIALWNEYTPNLYEVTISIVRDGQYIMTQTSEIIGFRDLSTKERAFYLNDLPVMLRGKHDGMIFPLTGYAPMDKASWKKLFGVAKERLFRGSYAMCDAPQGHIQVNMPDNCHSYDEIICPMPEDEDGVVSESSNEGKTERTTKEHAAEATENAAGEIEIQYGTGTKKVKTQACDELIPHVPVVSHEIGQYEVYPDYTEIEKYTGVLQPENLRLFRKRL